MSGKKRMAVAVTAVIALLGVTWLSACSGGGSAQSIVNAAVKASAKQTSFQSEITSALVIQANGGTNPGTMHLTVQGSGDVDVTGKKTYLALDLNLLTPSQEQQQLAMDVYIADGWQYVKIPMGDAGDKWVKIALPGDWAASGSQVAQQADLLKNATQATLAGTEVLDGIDCNIISASPDIPTLIKLILAQAQTQYTIGLADADLTSFDLTKVIKSVTLKEWIAKDTSLFQKTEATIVMQLTPADTGSDATSFDTIDLQISMGLKFSNYGKTLTVVIPQDALNAQEASSAGSLDTSSEDATAPTQSTP